MNGFLMQPLALASAQLVLSNYGPYDANFPAANLLDPQPKLVWQAGVASSGAISAVIEIDLLADTAIDTLALLFSNFSGAATWSLFGAPAAFGPAGIAIPANQLLSGSFRRPATSATARFHGLAAFNPATVRYLALYIYDNSNPEGVVRAGNILVGKRLATAWPYEQGSGRKAEDQGSVRTLPGGESFAERGAVVPVFRWTWSNMTETDLQALWATLIAVGTGVPVLMVEADTGTLYAEAIHYGLLEGLDFDDRTLTDKSAISLRIREML